MKGKAKEAKGRAGTAGWRTGHRVVAGTFCAGDAR